jgi:hypothetical protein
MNDKMDETMQPNVRFLMTATCALLFACGDAATGTLSPSLSSTPLQPCVPPSQDAGVIVDASPPTDAEAGSPDTGGPDESTPTLFAFAVEGVSSPVAAEAISGAVGHITISSYPESTSGTIHYGALPVGFDDAFSQSYCAGIETKAKAALGTSALARFNKKFIREGGGVALRVPVSPLVGNRFRATAASAAIKAGAKSSTFVIDNPLLLESVQLSIAFDIDAMSHIIGETDAIASAQETYLAQSSTSVMSIGEFATALGAKDVLCDFATGKARFEFTTTGVAGRDVYFGFGSATNLQGP